MNGFRISEFGLRIWGWLGLILTAAVAVPGAALGQAGSSYAGQERREIKALSPQEIHSYRIGEGMGFAKAAELNHYPGPKHVLALARGLGLSAEQVDRSEQIRARMHGEAVRLGNAIVEKERALDSLFAGGTATGEALAKATKEIAALQGELRAVHLMAHIEMKQVLTAAQIALYDSLRGYASGQHEHREHGSRGQR